MGAREYERDKEEGQALADTRTALGAHGALERGAVGR
jgi:hypothetical protein